MEKYIMSFNYEVMSEQDAMNERFQLIKEGEYDAVITSSHDKHSASSGNPMMDMTVAVYDANGRAYNIRDFLVFTKPMMWKIVQFSKATHLFKEYEEGRLCSALVIGKNVRVKVSIEGGQIIPNDKLNGKSFGATYPDKNKIEYYVTEINHRPTLVKNHTTENIPFLDDDIEF